MFQEKQPGFIEIGRVLKTIGLDGLCAVETYGSTLVDADLPFKVYLGKDLHNCAVAVVEKLVRHNKVVVCQFQNVTDREAAEALRDQVIFLEQERLPELGDNEYYHFDLEGLSLCLETGEQLGIVENVINYPSTDALEVRLNDRSLVMVPFLPDCIIRVDKIRKQIFVNKDFLAELL